jgi:CRISPR-associated protein Csm2
MKDQIFSITANPPRTEIDQSLMRLASPAIDLFDATAKRVAEELAQPQVLEKKWNKRERRDEYSVKRLSNANKSTQLRKFYDELCLWHEKSEDLASFTNNLPFIKMLNAKVAYAKGREHVDDKFLLLVSACLEQVGSADEQGFKALQNMKLFLEAILGFYKAVER